MRCLLLFVVLALTLNACATLSEKPIEVYQLGLMQHLQKQANWYFSGRLALVDEKNSISASINWRHRVNEDNIELYGPLAQGRVAITIVGDKITVDDGEQQQAYLGRVDSVLTALLGVDIPAQALRFWVLGVTDPEQAYTEISDGFIQNGWMVRYKELQNLNSETLPRKISSEKEKTKVRLVIDQWELS
ncbi:lipoprotein insertase outer membrane protein LolB [Methylomonas sp. AM2-LC]|uniref:lipoprotein insertase outer membrane protein LolB n=1 Tax=Methylomonas sp. AM2-LC TaxID=3153301 RepID=UPI0032677D26